VETGWAYLQLIELPAPSEVDVGTALCRM